MLRFSGHTIVNLKELKKYADFQQIYEQRADFVEFAKIHCLPVPLVMKNGENYKFLDKAFWLELFKALSAPKTTDPQFKEMSNCSEYIYHKRIEFYEGEGRRRQIADLTAVDIVPENIDLWDDYVERAIHEFLETQDDISKDEIDEIREELRVPFSANDEYKQKVRSEMELLRVSDRIVQSYKAVGNCKEPWKAAMLYFLVLIITESEINELAFTGRRADDRKISEPKKKDTKEDTIQNKENRKKDTETPSGNFVRHLKLSPLPKIQGVKAVRSETEYVTCRREPYIWQLFEGDILENGQRIQTMKVEAKKGTGRKATIQLYSARQQKVVFEYQMAPGECRYYNATATGIICVLPEVSDCKTAKIYRLNDSECTLEIQYKASSRTERLNFGTEISSFAVSTDGEIFLRRGRAILNRYLPAQKDMEIANQFDSISYEEFVDVRLVDGGFLLLTNKGRVHSNLPEWDGKKAARLSE